MSYTKEEIKTELQKYKLPWISKIWKKFGIVFLRYSFFPVFLIIAILGIIYNSSMVGVNEWMWILDKTIILFYIFGIGAFALISHIAELITVNKLRRKLGLSHMGFKILIESYQITGM